MANSWSTKNSIKPREVMRYSNIKYIFNCQKCNYEFNVALNTIQGDIYCPMCINKTEKILYEWLTNCYENVKYQVRYKWCKNIITNMILPFDFEYNNIIIELDGPQHFRQIHNWKAPEIQLQTDKYKMQCALNNKKHIIRISQEDVLLNRNNWNVQLKTAVEELINCNEPSIRYIGIDSKYFQ